MGTGNVSITINDGGTGTVVLPGSNIQVVIGCSSTGTAAVPVATRSAMTLQSSFGYGPLVEAAGQVVSAGGTVIAIKAATNTTGSQKAVQFTGTGTSVITATGNAYDDYFVVFSVISGGTIGTGPITFQISLDAGRNFGPNLSLGTANTYVIPNTGITLNFAAGTLVTGDKAQFATVAPSWNTAGVQACLTALLASVYSTTGWGSMHVVTGLAGAAASDVTNINNYLDVTTAPAFASNYVYTRAYTSARDVIIPTAWGGSTSESESTWMTSIETAFSAVSAKRVSVGAGCYNMSSALGSGLGQGGSVVGTPAYRRQLSWAAASRQVLVPPQRLISRVRDGSLQQIIQNPLTDPTDGFVYHDERLNPGLDYLFAGTGGRFMAACTRVPSLPGFYITDPLLMSPLGSQFTLMPLGLVMDEACDIVHQIGQLEINEDVRLNSNGTIYVNDAVTIQNEIGSAIDSNLFATNQISQPATVVVDQTTDVETSGTVDISVTIAPRGYILSEVVQIQYS